MASRLRVIDIRECKTVRLDDTCRLTTMKRSVHEGVLRVRRAKSKQTKIIAQRLFDLQFTNVHIA